MLARHLPGWLFAALYVAVLAGDLVVIVARLFSLHPRQIFFAFDFAGEIDLFASPLYATVIGALTLTTALAVWIFSRERQALRAARLTPVIAATIVFAIADGYASYAPAHAATPEEAGSPTVTSAVQSSGFETAVREHDGRNFLLVIVEGLGAFADQEHQQLLADRFAAATLHNVTAGTAPFFGSTTAGEMRELCVSRESYELLLEEPQPCLPGLLRHAGYDTIGIHGYPGHIFEREDWWPNAGFNRMLFAADLYPGIEGLCGGTFRGICDREIGARLIDLVGGDRGPRFIYWLTLNTHVPIRPGDGTPRLDCEDGGPFDNDEVCYMTELWIDVLDSVTAIAGDERLRPLDVLVVGDHAPPLWSRSGRALFRPGEVSWFRLAPKGRVEAGRQEAPRRSAPPAAARIDQRSR